MISPARLAFLGFVLATSHTPVTAAEDLLLAVPGKVLYENTLATRPGAPWLAAKGTWAVVDGALRGGELAADHHPAMFRTPQKLGDCIIQYEFKFLEGARLTTLYVMDAKSHVCRLLMSPTFFQVQKDDHDHDGPDQAVVFHRVKAGLKPGVWHTVRLEIVGDTMLGRVDDLIGQGSNELLGKEKAGYGFSVTGQSADFRNLKVWEATANPNWDKVKAGIKNEVPPAVAPRNQSLEPGQ